MSGDGTLPKNCPHEHWIWNEGKPTDIRSFEERRIVLIGEAPYERMFDTARHFDRLAASVEIAERLTADQVADGLARMGRRASELRD